MLDLNKCSLHELIFNENFKEYVNQSDNDINIYVSKSSGELVFVRNSKRCGNVEVNGQATSTLSNFPFLEKCSLLTILDPKRIPEKIADYLEEDLQEIRKGILS